MAMSNCSPLTAASLLGSYGLYDTSKPGCDRASEFAIGKPMFFGKNNVTNDPMFAVIDFENFKIAKTGMIVASCIAAALGVTTIILAIKLNKK
jgi:hypothetical protein